MRRLIELLRMNLEQLQKKLLAAARANPPADRVPYAFEKRILAQLAAQPPLTARRALGAGTVAGRRSVRRRHALAGNLVFHLPHRIQRRPRHEDLSQQFEQTLLASADQLEENW